jgi:hypothetical protein
MTRVNIKSGDTLKTGDTEPNLVATLYKDNGNPYDLSAGTPTVEFALAEANESTLVVDSDTNASVSITDAANGEVSYSWQAGDTDTKGTYEGEFRVDDSNGATSFPNRGTFTVHIEEGLN